MPYLLTAGKVTKLGARGSLNSLLACAVEPALTRLDLQRHWYHSLLDIFSIYACATQTIKACAPLSYRFPFSLI